MAVAQRTAIEARAVLASALAVPPRALDAIGLDSVSSTGCDRLGQLGEDSLQAAALVERATMTSALADYALAEANLRMQVAHQYPDLDLGPGFIWDQGVHRWTVALALPGLLAFRNRAPIDEATTARAAAGASVFEAQLAILSEIAGAAERCRGAGIERAAADSQVAVARAGLERTRRAFDRGETTRLEPALAALALARAERARGMADARLQAAGLSVEAATGGWGGSAGPAWPDPRFESGQEGASP